jgi:hypothetical protein
MLHKIVIYSKYTISVTIILRPFMQIIIIIEYKYKLVIPIHSKYIFVNPIIFLRIYKIHLCTVIGLQLIGDKLFFMHEKQTKCCSHGRIKINIVTN